LPIITCVSARLERDEPRGQPRFDLRSLRYKVTKSDEQTAKCKRAINLPRKQRENLCCWNFKSDFEVKTHNWKLCYLKISEEFLLKKKQNKKAEGFSIFCKRFQSNWSSLLEYPEQGCKFAFLFKCECDANAKASQKANANATALRNHNANAMRMRCIFAFRIMRNAKIFFQNH